LNIISGENKGPGTKYERILERDWHLSAENLSVFF
jgi:hypothetical protein